MRYGVFDSGLGGMTVLKQLTEIMPYNDYIYFGDVARVPYGTRSNDTITRYAGRMRHSFTKITWMPL